MAQEKKEQEVKVGLSVQVKLDKKVEQLEEPIKKSVEELRQKFKASLLEKVSTVRDQDNIRFIDSEPEEYEIEY